MNDRRPAPTAAYRAPRRLIERGLDGLCHRRVLMLQGPIGPFFPRLARDLRDIGAWVAKVNFNGGDRLFSGFGSFDEVIDYRAEMTAWPAAFERLLDEHRIDTVLLFGDCRPVHRPAVAIAKARGLEIGVFEEGYLRPDYITVERDGVNSHSTLPKDPTFYRRVAVAEPPPTLTPGSTFGMAAQWGMLYYAAASLGSAWFPHYRHHRRLSWRECRPWLRSYWRKLVYRMRERHIDALYLGETPERFFLVPLQTSGDAQVRFHSDFETVERFIEHVMHSFAANADPQTRLAIKQHPLDRGFSDHGRLIADLANALGIADRCDYIHDQHLPTLLKKAVGVVTINSTVGLSALGEGVPVAACGEAIYDIVGLTFQGPLADFWNCAPQHAPDPVLWRAFRGFLIASTQFNGSFYKRLPEAGNASGVLWDSQTQRALVAQQRGRPARGLPSASGG